MQEPLEGISFNFAFYFCLFTFCIFFMICKRSLYPVWINEMPAPDAVCVY